MPEGPEVALTSQILNTLLKNKTLHSINFTSGRFMENPPINYQQFIDNLPMKLKSVNSKGKFMWFHFYNKKQNWYIWNTFGLTGIWSFRKFKYLRAEFIFSNKKLYYSDMLSYGTFKFSNSEEELKTKLNKIAPDFLKEQVDISKITRYNIPIVKLLMSQTKIGSGLGNYLVSEILYRAKISPFCLGSQLNSEQIKKLSKSIQYLTKLAYFSNEFGYMINLEKSNKIKRINYHPKIKISGEFKFNVYRRKFDLHGNPVKKDKIIESRTTYWVPNVQKC
jgi:formamidopyrimidine-DNA glycosylase